MFKHIVALIAFSVAVIFFMSYAQQGLQGLLSAHDWIAEMLSNVFSPGQAGSVSRSLIALLALPIIVGLVPTLIYWLVRKNWFPYFMNIVWVVWLIQIGALVIMSGAATTAAAVS